ncbi:MAG: hypothetical protein QUS07_03325 [Methanothrix sp.]|nr:hypothetical protein [Methanothrix sp.]
MARLTGKYINGKTFNAIACATTVVMGIVTPLLAASPLVSGAVK